MGRGAEPCSTSKRVAETAYFEYDKVGNRTTLVAPAGELSYYGYDALDRLAWLRADAFGIDAATYYSYDAVGNRTGLTDAELHTTSFAYDALRRLLHEQDALGKTEYYAYDAVGNLTQLTNGDGQTTYFAYDVLDRRTEAAFPEGTSAYYAYDAGSNLTEARDACETDSFVYDALNRPVQRTILGLGTLYFEYDLAGRRTMVQDWTGAAVYYTYDRRGLSTQAEGVKSSNINYPAQGTGNADGRLLRVLTGRLTAAESGCRLRGGELGLAGVEVRVYPTHNKAKVGNRRYIVENGTPTYYEYNEANELLHEVTPGGETAYYAYDGRGNQVTREVLGGDTTYFAYNSRNLITRIDSTKPGFTPNTFKYNALGQRIEKMDSTGTSRYVWDGLNILLELDASGNVKRRYTYGYSPIEGVSSLISVHDELGCPCFYHFDQVGGVRQLTDRWQNTIKAYEFEAFGRILKEIGQAPNDFTFPATCLKLGDTSRLTASPTRVYDSTLGRWTTRDTQRPSWDYHSLGNAPLGSVDPDGAHMKFVYASPGGAIVPPYWHQYSLEGHSHRADGTAYDSCPGGQAFCPGGSRGTKEADIRNNPAWCADAWFTGMLHPGATCYRRFSERAGGPGDQYCFYTNGVCCSSPDKVSPAAGRKPSGACRLHCLDVLVEHFSQDVLGSAPSVGVNAVDIMERTGMR